MRPQDALVAIQLGVDLALVPDVVAAGDHVDAGVEQAGAVDGVRPMPPARFSPLAVTKSMCRSSRSGGRRCSDRVAAGLADHVADHQHAHVPRGGLVGNGRQSVGGLNRTDSWRCRR